MNKDIILAAIGSTEASTFNEFCIGLGKECPDKGDKRGWAAVLAELQEMERDNLVNIVRADGRISALRLTPTGAAQARLLLDKGRELFGLLADEE